MCIFLYFSQDPDALLVMVNVVEIIWINDSQIEIKTLNANP